MNFVLATTIVFLTMISTTASANEDFKIKCKNDDPGHNIAAVEFAIEGEAVTGTLRPASEFLMEMPFVDVPIGDNERMNLVLYKGTFKRSGQWISFKLGWSDNYDFLVNIVNNGEEGQNVTILTDTDGAPLADRFTCSFLK